jgi:hypothetical protein
MRHQVVSRRGEDPIDPSGDGRRALKIFVAQLSLVGMPAGPRSRLTAIVSDSKRRSCTAPVELAASSTGEN